ncbi:alpha/beta hydrolase [Naumannella halotolerans]|uniref:alpha/beta hydrolase n=1 Tax=Naumannella halotolerans TaxID=993414 RepID=UPI00370D72E5
MKRGVATGLGVVAVVIGALLVVLAVAAIWIPGPLQELGIAVYGSYGPWVVIIGALMFGAGLLVRRLGRTVLGWFGAALATPALLLGLVVCAPQAVVAFSEGTVPTPANTLGIASTENTAPDRTAVYATLEDGTELQAQLWLPRNDSLDPRPALIWMHGGGFVGGDPAEDAGWHRELAEAGYPVISVQYRLSPPPRWQEAPSDVACALSWVREQSRELDIDPEQIVLGGSDAGGNLALTVAYGLDQPPAEGTEAESGIGTSCGDLPEAPAGVIAISPQVDLTVPTKAGDFPWAEFLGGSPQEAAEAYAYASPINRVREDLPRTLLITGQYDPVTTQAVADRFASALRGQRVDVRHLIYPFGGHDFDAPDTLGEEVRDTVALNWLEQWFPMEI